MGIIKIVAETCKGNILIAPIKLDTLDELPLIIYNRSTGSRSPS
jgi:hypothetical protein